MRAARISLALGMAIALAAPTSSRAQTTDPVLALERATYLVHRLFGSTPVASPDALRISPRLDGFAQAGVAIAPDVIVTTAANVAGGDAWVVHGVDDRAGAESMHAAVPIHVDMELEVAFLRVDGALPHYVPLPDAAPSIAPGAAVTFSGLRRRDWSRREGEVVSVEPTGAMRIRLDRGGSVVGRSLTDAAGQWVGIVDDVPGSAVSMSGVLAAWARRPAQTPAIPPSAQLVARGLGLIAGGCDGGRDDDALVVGREALALTTPDAFADAILATALARVGLCAREGRALMEAATPTELALFEVSARLARRALDTLAATRVRYLSLPLLAERWPVPRPPSSSRPPPQLGLSIVDPPPRARPRRRGGWTTTVTSERRFDPGSGPGRGTVPGMGAEPLMGGPPREPAWQRTWP